MKIKRNKIIVIILILVAIVAVGIALYIKIHQETTAPVSIKPGEEQKQLQAQADAAGPVDSKKDTEAYRRQQAADAAAKSTESTSKASIYISSLSQDNQNVYVGAIVDNQTSGTCTATFSSGGSSFNKTAPLGLVSNYYACQGFTVAKSDFPDKGDWNVKVQFTGNNSTGTTDTQKVTIN